MKKSTTKPKGTNDGMHEELRSRTAAPLPKTPPRIRRRNKSSVRIVDAFDHEKPCP